MGCPAWGDCNKKSCIEQRACMSGDYWAKYWQNKKITNAPEWQERKEDKKAKAEAQKLAYRKSINPCVKLGDWCDKKEACQFLDRCVMTLSRISANQDIVNALRGPHTLKGILKVLRQYDPEPMRSYYFSQRKNNQHAKVRFKKK